MWSLRSETLAGIRVKCPSLSSGCHQKCPPSIKFNAFPFNSCRVLICVHVDRYDVATGLIICSFLLASAPKGFLCGVQFWYKMPATCSQRLYINYQLWCTDYYLFIKYFSPLHVSSLKCLSSGGYSCTHAAYGTVTLCESSWWPVGTQFEWELTVGRRLLVGVLRQYHMLYVYKCILLKMSTWGSKHVEEDSILWINNNQCIKVGN